jgi:flagellar biosynthesis protein FlhF
MQDEIAGMSHQELSDQFRMMMQEMRGMRSSVQTQLTTMTWNNHLQNNPVKAKILSTLLAANFSASLSRQLAEKLPNSLDLNRASAWIKGALARNLDTIKDESELLDQGGVFALVGPTGVGKTTTTAKLAARYVMKHGTQNLGLITTDGYRIGGHEQLRIYGKILGVMVYAVKDEADLKIALNELKHKHTILIDTVGVSQRDRMVTEQIAMLSNMNVKIKKLLCLNATCTGETLTDVIRAYKGRALDGCIITKLDEAATIGNTLDVIIREKLKLYYTTHGQRVPEDIKLANKVELISRAMTLNSTSWPFQYLEEELPFVVANVDNYADYVKATEVGHA